MLPGHEIAVCPWKVLERDADKADEIIDKAIREVVKTIMDGGEDPEMYEFDVIRNEAEAITPDVEVNGVGTVRGDRVIVGIALAWRKGSTKPKFHGGGRLG